MTTTQATLQLIYASAATTPFSAQELGMLLVRARANNQKIGVTGLLVHHHGSFFQILEGDGGAVDSLYARINQDKRHQRVLTLSRAPVAERSFGEWSMGYADGGQEALRNLPGFNDFLRRGFELINPVAGASRARDLAMAFRDGRFRQHIDGR